MKYLRLEIYKMKRRKVLLTFLLILGVELLFVFSNYGKNANFISMIADPGAPAWQDLIIGPGAMNGLFFPILTAVIASRICDMEHRGNTWKLLECNNEKRRTIWFCKFMIVEGLMLSAIMIQALVIVAYGNAVGIAQTLPVSTLVSFVVGTAMVTSVTVTIQLFFSLAFPNQLVPMSVGMIGALIGFISTLLPPGLRNILIWGNYAELMVLGQNTSGGNLQAAELQVQEINFVPLGILFVIGIAAFVLFQKKNLRDMSIKEGWIMLINAIWAENLKSRHSKMWVAVVILPLITAAIGAVIYGINASAHLYDGAVWQQLWLQTGLFYGYFFFPILISICASYLWRLEHTNHNWNSLMTVPVSRSTVFCAKLVVLGKSVLEAQILLMAFVIIVGKVIFRFSQPIPVNMLWWLFMGWFSALSVGAVQLYLSMRIRSFAVPVGMAVCLSIAGLGCHILGFSSMFPYSQIILGLSSQDETLPVDSMVSLVLMVIVYIVLFILLAAHRLKKADVVAG